MTALATDPRAMGVNDQTFDLRRPCQRWTPGRKAQLLYAIERRHISLDDALSIHRISRDEIMSWGIVSRDGSIASLRVTKLKRTEGEGSCVVPDLTFPPEYELTAPETRMLALLVAHDVLTKETAYTALYPDFNTAPEVKILDIMVYHIRKKIKPFGIVIATLWGRGWSLGPETRERLKSEVSA